MAARAIAGAVLTLLACKAIGQPTPAFEVTSVRPASADPRQRVGRFGCTEGEGFAAGSMAVTAAIRFAYQVEYFQILGGPSWAETEPYEIVGKPPSPVSEPRCRLMLQALLRDRFK